MRTAALVLVALLVVLAGCNFGPGTPTDAPAPTTSGPAATTAPPGGQTPSGDPVVKPPDPSSDRLGWEDGYWYNETVAVDRSDGLNDSELDAVVARAMARVEVVRELEFESRVPVKVVSRAEYRNNTSDLNITAAGRLHQNVKWEAMLMVNESTDAVAVRQANRGATVGGFYSPSEERIVIVSENTTSPKMNEITLAQELFHALQDQHFNLSAYNQSTEERHNAKDGIIEGDGNYVDYLYEQRCNEEWECLMPQESGGGGGASDIHVGQFIVTFTPYSEGPEFVRGIREEGGWAAVDDVYANPPQSTEQVIHPEKYPEDEPTAVRIEDTASNGWHVLDVEAGIDYAEFGEAGLFSMFWYASFEESVQRQAPATVVVPYTDFFEYESEGSSELEDVGPYSYAHEATEGWDGDRLKPYVNGSSAATNETGYVWKTAWDSEADAREFAEAYVALLEYRDAEPVPDRTGTYRIPEDAEYADAYYVSQEGTTVVIVNAPTVDALDDVRAGAGTQD